ncbi:hypothetical protein C900_03609 [Fulvivirga imtechensis AK7]|uniref:DinB superfamily protein n=1 Tax=Fulvivirga imtechensis AK7 TaxID=1237149 RepID=L8JQY3_9BACT|nr:DUF1572 family protein [Fulvivirga imtechensis]ELR70628.1 hypothetical protein C900_03609 [Fulvivirga imtechensis AK7]
MVTEPLKTLFNRDLHQLKTEIELFQKTDHLWAVKNGISNSAGNLCLHLCGNLQHFFGTVLGDTGYVRQREREFSTRNMPTPELLREIEEAQKIVNQVLSTLSPSDLQEIYPVSLWNQTFTTEFFIIHLHSHLNYHLGQINYLRRMLEPA